MEVTSDGTDCGALGVCEACCQLKTLGWRGGGDGDEAVSPPKLLPLQTLRAQTSPISHCSERRKKVNMITQSGSAVLGLVLYVALYVLLPFM